MGAKEASRWGTSRCAGQNGTATTRIPCRIPGAVKVKLWRNLPIASPAAPTCTRPTGAPPTLVITAYDGFTLRDQVSYNRQYNEANGEDNCDGKSQNCCWNCGVEGETSDPQGLALFARQQRNFLVTLFLSQGVPMLGVGEEIGSSQRGNNNAYSKTTGSPGSTGIRPTRTAPSWSFPAAAASASTAQVVPRPLDSGGSQYYLAQPRWRRNKGAGGLCQGQRHFLERGRDRYPWPTGRRDFGREFCAPVQRPYELLEFVLPPGLHQREGMTGIDSCRACFVKVGSHYQEADPSPGCSRVEAPPQLSGQGRRRYNNFSNNFAEVL